MQFLLLFNKFLRQHLMSLESVFQCTFHLWKVFFLKDNVGGSPWKKIIQRLDLRAGGLCTNHTTNRFPATEKQNNIKTIILILDFTFWKSDLYNFLFCEYAYIFDGGFFSWQCIEHIKVARTWFTGDFLFFKVEKNLYDYRV